MRLLTACLADNARFAPRLSDLSTAAILPKRGCTSTTIDRFCVPFLGGILVDGYLESSTSLPLLTLKTLATSDIAVPAFGMGRSRSRSHRGCALQWRT
ncbi:MAG: hypothetical protein HYX65_02150 [Gemmatimonadetes bacterium]|nr:hypothetical protein [Gemmatimonadota bacterium]